MALTGLERCHTEGRKDMRRNWGTRFTSLFVVYLRKLSVTQTM